MKSLNLHLCIKKMCFLKLILKKIEAKIYFNSGLPFLYIWPAKPFHASGVAVVYGRRDHFPSRDMSTRLLPVE